FATGCDAVMAGEPALLQTTVQIRGGTPVRGLIPVRGAPGGMVFAREHGGEVTLGGVDSQGRGGGGGGSPGRGAGGGRAGVAARPHEHYYVVLTGKERADASGSVDLLVVDLRSTVKSSCLVAQTRLANADSAYAAGQSVTRATRTTPGISSEKSYQEAARGY